MLEEIWGWVGCLRDGYIHKQTRAVGSWKRGSKVMLRRTGLVFYPQEKEQFSSPYNYCT